MPLPPTFEARVVATRTLTPQVKELVFERVDGAPMLFEAGQWVNLDLPIGDVGGKRSYSIASAPDGTPRFEVAVTLVDGGPGSTFLHALEPGAMLRVTGPQGFFTRPLDKAAPSLFVATGTGVTPLRSMLRAATLASNDAPITLLVGVRHEADMLYADELGARTSDVLRVEYTLSRPSDGWHGRRGYVQEHVPALFHELAALHRGAPHVYICGLERMVSAVREILKHNLGLPRQQVHSERYD
jgi:CDP-4-dehydro-6-deoxyglucose reductase, E3